jgi:hypothetical protein
MGEKSQLVVGIAVACFIVVVLAAIALMIAPTLQGVGAATAGAMGTNLTTFYNSSQTAAISAAQGYAATNSIVPYLAIAFGILAALGISLTAYFHFGKGGSKVRRHRRR